MLVKASRPRTVQRLHRAWFMQPHILLILHVFLPKDFTEPEVSSLYSQKSATGYMPLQIHTPIKVTFPLPTPWRLHPIHAIFLYTPKQPNIIRWTVQMKYSCRTNHLSQGLSFLNAYLQWGNVYLEFFITDDYATLYTATASLQSLVLQWHFPTRE
jgi:hypothetical protein